MKLYFPLAGSGVYLPTLWNSATYLPWGGGSVANPNSLVNGIALPVYYLSTQVPIGKYAPGSWRITEPFAVPPYGSESIPARVVIPFSGKGRVIAGPQQIFCAAVGLSEAGTVTPARVFPEGYFAASGFVQIPTAGISGATMFPGFIYVYRPSTNSVVGIVAVPKFSTANVMDNITSFGTSRAFGGSDGGGEKYFTSWTQTWTTTMMGLYWNLSSVNALAGDLVVYEMWGSNYFSYGGAVDSEWTIWLQVGWSGEINPSNPSAGYSYDQSYGLATTGDVGGARGFNTFFYWNDLSPGPAPAIPTLFSAPVSLIDVSPGTGPKISLTFDNPVGITGPTIGPAFAGLGVTGATQIDPTHIDLATDYPPVHPIGSATVPSVPVPTGGGAYLL